jgi:hypothetical protein
MLFDDEDKAGAETLRSSIVAPARRSPSAARKASSKRTEEGAVVHSFQTLLKDLATLVKNHNRTKDASALSFDKVTTPTPLQQRAFDLLGVSAWM